ncbi:MAG: exodeoxyribonuclease VII large subunit [Rhodospirillaceae bacterium]|nr:exodeoxyribonuclease VII large subunit [Rhodospirillaceae bacterium]
MENLLALEPRAAPSNLPEYTVGEISHAIKRRLEGEFERVRVRGEISGFKRHASGHLYFALKDTDAVLDSVCWRTTAARLRIKPEDGLEVVATGRITTFPGRSKYQLVVDAIEVAGTGALLKLLEERRRRLAAEGLFDAARKKRPPLLPDVIGVVTSPSGAVIRDILHRLSDRFPRHVVLWPVPVQGEGAAPAIAAAIRGFNALRAAGGVPRPDVLIVARGGGSLEDLWAFNEEEVVRAAAESAIPLISAVGHETDTTLIDFAADVRAPTPTAAAEMAVPVRAELMAQVLDCGGRVVAAFDRWLRERRTRIEGLARGLPDPVRLIEDKTQRLDLWAERLANARGPFFARRAQAVAHAAARLRTPHDQIRAKALQLEACAAALARAAERLVTARRHDLDRLSHRLRPQMLSDLVERRRAALEACGRLLESYSYQQVLARGFVLVRDAADRPVTSAGAMPPPGGGIVLQFYDGEVQATAGGRTRRTARTRGGPDDPQGSLL